LEKNLLRMLDARLEGTRNLRNVENYSPSDSVTSLKT
jgi:hypothetical protein